MILGRSELKIFFRILVIFGLYASHLYATGVSDRSQESADYYSLMYQVYQNQADMYKGMAFVSESENKYLSFESAVSTPTYNPWHGSQLAFGAGGSTGDSNTSNAQINTIINYKPEAGESGWNFNTIEQYDYFYSGTSTNNKNRLYVQQNGSYMYNRYNGMFAQVSYLNDVNDGYFYTWNQNIGYQLQIFSNKTNNLVLSVGPGIQERQVTATTGVEIKPSWLTQITYNLNLNKLITLTEQLQNVATATNTSTYSISTVTLQVFDGFGINFNYQATYNSQPEPGKAALSTISGVNFVYAID